GSGFDPSLFHDQEGRIWLLNALWDYRKDTPNKSVGIVLQEYSEVQGRLIGDRVPIFSGTQLAKTEAPHLYYHNECYYLLTAEGGTGAGHAVTVCRSKTIT
ncbi:glycoside hydrolase 43 family protein, partial [Escherichia coli]